MQSSPLIFDVGMHNGEDTAYYLARGCRVVAIEANPLLTDAAAVRFAAEIAAGRLLVENVGVAENEGTAEFWVNDERSEWSSFNRDQASRRGCRAHAIAIACLPLSRLVARHGVPHFMKIDIEGHDRICLRDLGPADAPDYISVENYGAEAVDDLARLGYRSFKAIDQVNLTALTMPPSATASLYWALRSFRDRSLHDRSALFARFVGKLGGRAAIARILEAYRATRGYRHPDGASGPYAEDTPGRWCTAEAMRRTLVDFADWFQKSGLPPDSRWFDLHARKLPAS